MAAQLQQQKQPQFSHKPIEEMMKDLGVDSCVQLSDSDKVVYKDGSSSDVTSCISSAGDATCSLKESYVDHESPAPIHHLPYPPPAYCGYYYPGYDATFGGLNEHGYYIPPDALDFQYPVMQADNGSLIYLIPGMHPPMYNPYGPYSPVTVVGVDGQYVGPQPYSPGPVVQTSITSPGYLPTLPYSEFVPSAHLWDPSVFVEDQTYQNGHGKILEIPGSRTSISLPGHAHIPPSKNSLRSDFNNQLKTVSQHVITYQSDAQSKGYFQFAKFPSFNYGKGGMLHPTNNFKANTREWSGTEKPKSRSKVNSINDVDSHNEQNHAPRTTDAKVSLTFGGNAAALLGSTDQNGNSNSAVAVIKKDQYNLPDFSTKYDHAYFFVIKSYSEDDIHKSIKYNVWASTPNGNKRLDNAYQDAQNKLIEKGSKCPVFLFFSVNASGQFCGVAEMIGQVDFNKSMDFWQQNKWTGYFPVKWHIIKDVPNPQLRQIILENNENKPVTNSRDTQEVRYPQGIEMLNIFKNYVSKTSLLDDFEFYESRQKVMQEKKLRPLMLHSDYKQKSDGLASGIQAEDVSTEQMKIMKETQAGYKAKE